MKFHQCVCKTTLILYVQRFGQARARLLCGNTRLSPTLNRENPWNSLMPGIMSKKLRIAISADDRSFLFIRSILGLER